MNAITHPELTPAVLAELRAQLEAQRDRLAAEIAANRREEGAGGTPEQDPNILVRGDLGDQSVDLEAWDTTYQETLDLAAQLTMVEHALAKFAAGAYGLCEECGQPIPLARLRVIPEARYDVAHQPAPPSRQ
jgi:DnaK suppressor protein